MILGEADRERVITAELKAATADAQLAYALEQRDRARHDHRDAELRVVQQTQYAEQLRAWGTDLGREATAMLAEAEVTRASAIGALAEVEGLLRELHVEADAAPVCRHCGHAFPCPTLGVLPSSA